MVIITGKKEPKKPRDKYHSLYTSRDWKVRLVRKLRSRRERRETITPTTLYYWLA
jgi:hypothetical protein